MQNSLTQPRRFWLQSLQTRLTLFALAFALVPALLVSLLIFTQARAIFAQQIGSNALELAESTGNDAERFLNSRADDVALLARSETLTDPENTVEAKIAFLRTVQHTYNTFTTSSASVSQSSGSATGQSLESTYANLYYVDTKGQIIAATDATGGDQSQQPWFAAANQGKPYISDSYYLLTAQDAVITFADQVIGPDGQPQGVIAANIRVKTLDDLVGERTLGATGDVYLINSDGRKMADPKPSEVFTNVQDVPGVQAVINGQRGYVVGLDPATNTEELIAYAPLSGVRNWMAIARVPTSEIYGEVDILANRAVLIVFASLVVVSVIIIVLTFRIVRPIQKLTVSANQLASGNFGVEIPVEGRDEIAQFAAAFRTMSGNIQRRDLELRSLNASLEVRVQERTLGLEKANQELQAASEALRKARDEALGATRIAQDSARIKSEFLSTMSHELRTPMNAIEGFTSILLSKMGGVQYNDKTQTYVSRINVNSKRLLQLINDFLDLSRIEAGRLELVNQPFSPKAAAQRWYDEIGVLADKKGIQLELICEPELPETIYGDEEAISKVALNLLSNAIKFTDVGKVSLAVRSIDHSWSIIVTDTGIGIPPHARELIFEEFRQVDQTSKRKYGGTGLGLAIVQKYARSMGGTVIVDSELGKGSVFTVTLPLNQTN